MSFWNLPLAISFVVSVLTTGGAAAALHHLGSDQRQNKDQDRHLNWENLSLGAKASLVVVGVLVTIIASVAFYRIWTEGVLSGITSLAILLATLVAVVMLISAWLVFWSAFSDGSPERDDLIYYTKLLRPHLKARDAYLAKAKHLERKIASMQRTSEPPAGSPEVTNGQPLSKGLTPGQGTYS